MSWRTIYRRRLAEKRPRELDRLLTAGELDELLDLAEEQASETYRFLTRNASPMQQATAREVVTAQIFEEIEAIPLPRSEAEPAIPDVCPELEEPVCFRGECVYWEGRCVYPEIAWKRKKPGAGPG